MLLNRRGECWVKHELLLWDFSEPLKCSLCRKALNGAREALHPFHLFLALRTSLGTGVGSGERPVG